MTRCFRLAGAALAVIALTASVAHAQAIGSIFGKVTDPSGGVLPGVTVTVSGPALQQPLVGTSSASGAYQFPAVPIGTYTVTFELSSFKKASRANVIITSGFAAPIDQKMELGQMSEEMTVSAAAPVVDTKKTNTGAVFTKDILENIPTARDPWQIINMTPGVQAGLNVGGSASGQQVGLSLFGTGANVQWNLEGGSITDLSSNSSPSYFNFDSFEQISVVTGGGDVSVQSSGLSINLVTKSGSNVFKGTALTTFSNDSMQSQNVSAALFAQGTNGFLSGNPVKRIANYSAEYGGPIQKNRLWWWAAADKQDINAGVLNFFDPALGDDCATYATAQRTGTLSGLITYDKLGAVQKCLANDKTLIKDLQWKFNYQLNAANKFQYLFTSDNKIRNRRGASATVAPESTTRQYSDSPWKLPLPTHSITHTWIATDKLVFTNQFTYVHGGFYLDYQDYDKCGSTAYNGSTKNSDYPTDPTCLWNTQSQLLRTGSYSSRSLTASYATTRHSTELKSDGTYFLSNMMGGDHSLKFGVGYRKNPIQTFSHYSGGARAQVQCVGNLAANCGASLPVAVGSATGIVPYQAVLYRDQLRNNDWWTYNGYIQDQFSRGRFRFNGGLRYDWQTSKYLGGCVPASVLAPTLLPSQCESATDIDPITGKKIQSFGNLSPRLSATYDLMGNGKTSIHSSFSYYFDTRITLANALGALFDQPALTWGPNASSGACSTTAGASCWNDANRDNFVQLNELIGIGSSANTRFDLNTGILTPAGNTVDPSAKIGRTREGIVGVQHELFANLAVGVDYVYRKYDNGTVGYTIGTQPGAALFPLSQIYTGPIPYTDPLTGITGNYYQVCATCTRPTGGTITVTRLNYEVYKGVILTMNKRFSNKWQANVSATLQKNPGFLPTGSFSDPTAIEYRDGVSTIAPFLFKANGSYAFGWGITASANWNINAGATRTMSINGPGNVSGGVSSTGAATTIAKTTIEFQARDAVRLDATNLLDLNAQKVLNFRGGKNRLKLTFDAFNVLNVATVLGYSSNNLSVSTSLNPSSIIPPRVFRVGASIGF